MTIQDKLFLTCLALQIGMMIQWHAHYMKDAVSGTDTIAIIVLSILISIFTFYK